MKKDTLLIIVLSAILFGLVITVVQKISDEQSVSINTTPTPTEQPISNNQPKETIVNSKQYSSAPEMQLNPQGKYQAVLETSAGTITIELNVADTPITANNFAFLAKEGFYDNTIFHRAIDGFMIQGGDPEGTGRGGPGYKFADEPFEGDYSRGVVAMANSGPNTNGSQFFIMHQDYPLPPNYIIFGKVTEGLEVVDAIATAPVTVGAGGENSQPVEPVTVLTVKIVE